MRKAFDWFRIDYLLLVGLVVLVVCLVRIAMLPGPVTTPDAKPANCGALDEDARQDGRLSIAGVIPAQNTIGGRVALCVYGVVSQASEARREQEQASRESALAAAEARLKSAGDLVEAAQDARKAGSAADQAKLDKMIKDAEADEAKARTDVATAAQALKSTAARSELTVFFNGQKSPAKIQAEQMSGVQLIEIDLTKPEDASSAIAEFWRKVFAAGPPLRANFSLSDPLQALSVRYVHKDVRIGLARAGADAPKSASPADLKLGLYEQMAALSGFVSFLILTLCMMLFAQRSTLLRENTRRGPRKVEMIRTLDAAKLARDAAQKDVDDAGGAAAAPAPLTTALADAETALADAKIAHDVPQPQGPVGPYSLGRVQMAFWFLLTTAGFLVLWLTIGQYNAVMTTSVLALIGISGTTGLAAVAINGEKMQDRLTKGFLLDIFGDDTGPQLQRIQAVAWTVILGLIFAWNVLWNFRFVEFGTELLLLMTFVNGLYLGFKPRETT